MAKKANGLVALSSAAVLTVYAAGYSRTRAAAERLEASAAERRPPIAIPTGAPIPTAAPVVEVAAPVAPLAPAAGPKLAVKVVVPKKEEEPEPIIAQATAPDQPTPVEPPAPTAPVEAPAAPAPAQTWKDGTYLGWGSSRHGDIQAQVVIEGGKIASATIAQCLTRYSCSVISKLPPEVPQRQSPDVDYVSGATQSTNAFYSAVVDALNKAK